MKTFILALWHDESGMIISAELVLVGTLAVLGMVAGLSQVRGAVNEEFLDLSNSLRSLNQSYSYSGMRGCKAFTAGSAFFEDGREAAIEFHEVYHTPRPVMAPVPCVVDQPCVTALPCPTGQPCADHLPCVGDAVSRDVPCGDCLPTPAVAPCPTPCDVETQRQAVPCCDGVPPVETRQPLVPLPAPQQQLPTDAPIDAESLIPPLPDEAQRELRAPVTFASPQFDAELPSHTAIPDPLPRESIFNVKRYLPTPGRVPVPVFAHRSSVW